MTAKRQDARMNRMGFGVDCGSELILTILESCPRRSLATWRSRVRVATHRHERDTESRRNKIIARPWATAKSNDPAY